MWCVFVCCAFFALSAVCVCVSSHVCDVCAVLVLCVAVCAVLVLSISFILIAIKFTSNSLFRLILFYSGIEHTSITRINICQIRNSLPFRDFLERWLTTNARSTRIIYLFGTGINCFILCNLAVLLTLTQTY